jgi:hypothetical protein
VPRRRPDAQDPVRRRHGVGEHQRALLGQQDGRLHRAAPVVLRLQPSGQLAPGLDRPQLNARHAVAPVELRPVRRGAVPAHEQVHVAHVIGLEHDDRLRGELVDA